MASMTYAISPLKQLVITVTRIANVGCHINIDFDIMAVTRDGSRELAKEVWNEMKRKGSSSERYGFDRRNYEFTLAELGLIPPSDSSLSASEQTNGDSQSNEAAEFNCNRG